MGRPLREGWMTWDEKRSRSGRDQERRSTRARRPRRAPFLRLLAYYAVVVGLAALLARYVPAVRDAFVAPIALPAAQDVPELAIGSGLTNASLGVRLRYQISPLVAPYIGVEYERAFGDTRRFLHAEGEDAGGFNLVAGIRFWF